MLHFSQTYQTMLENDAVDTFMFKSRSLTSHEASHKTHMEKTMENEGMSRTQYMYVMITFVIWFFFVFFLLFFFLL